MKFVKSFFQGLVAFVGGTILLAQVGTAVTSYGSAQRDSFNLRNSLAQDAELTASQLSQSLSVRIEGLTPGAQIVLRCNSDSLPPRAEEERDTICRAAVIEEIQEEQAEYLEFREMGAEARALGRQLGDQLEETEPASQWNAVVSGFRELDQLQSSTTCNEERDAVVERLRQPEDGMPASSRSDLLDQVLTGQALADEVTPEQVPVNSNLTVAAALIGQRTSGERCDGHGDSFIKAANLVRVALVAESTTVASDIRESHVANLNDKTGDVATSLLNPFYLGGIFIVILAWLLTRLIPDEPSSPLKVELVSPSDPQRSAQSNIPHRPSEAGDT